MIREGIDPPGQQNAHDSTNYSNHRGFNKEDQLNLTILSTNRFHDSNLARAFENRHDHRVGDAKRSNEQRDATEQTQHGIDDQKHGADLVELIDNRKTRETGVSEFLANFSYLHWIGNTYNCRVV